MDVIYLNIETFFDDEVSQNKTKLKTYFHEYATIKWHCSNEIFTFDEYIKANCEY